MFVCCVAFYCLFSCLLLFFERLKMYYKRRHIFITKRSLNKKLSCRRKTARCFVSLNISLNHSRSLNVIRNGTIRKLGYVFLFAFHSNYGSILYHFRDKARYWSKIAILSYPCIPRPVMWSRRKRHISFGMEN